MRRTAGGATGAGRRTRAWPRLRRAVVGVVVAILVIAAFGSIPGVPGHQQVSLLGDLAAADGNAAVDEAVPFLGDRPAQPCAMLESRFEAGNDLLRGHAIGLYATIWSSYQALLALYVASLSGDRSCRTDLEHNVAAIDRNYWDTSYHGSPGAFDQGPHAYHLPWDHPRVDDSLWMGLAVFRAYAISRSPVLLRRAEAVFRLAVGEWDPAKGGVYWEYHTRGTTSDDMKAVVSNAPAVVLGAALYSETGTPSYLTWSGRILHWLESNLLDHRSGLYDDHVNNDTQPAKVGTAKFTYNQGIMVGAMAALATVDPAHYPLSSAVELASRSMAYFKAHHTYGQPAFDAIWAENLLATASLHGNATFAREARSSVELATKADRSSSSSLPIVGSEAALRGLAELPASRYAELSYATGGARVAAGPAGAGP